MIAQICSVLLLFNFVFILYFVETHSGTEEDNTHKEINIPCVVSAARGQNYQKDVCGVLLVEGWVELRRKLGAESDPLED